MSVQMTPKLLLIDENGDIFHISKDVTKQIGLTEGDNFFSRIQMLNGSTDGMINQLQNGKPMQKLAVCGEYTILFNITKTDMPSVFYTITIEAATLTKDDDAEFIHLILKNSTIYNPNQNTNITIFARLSHELKTPLNAISSAIQLNQQVQYPYEKQMQYFDIMLRNCRQLTRLIGNIVDFAKIEEGQGVLFYHSHKICHLVRQIATHSSPTLELANIDLKLNLPDEEIEAVIDGEKIVHVVCNLLTNAIKFSEKQNEITISVTSDENTFTISVKDKGIGIPKHEQKRIFTKFAQVDNRSSRRYEGSGMGLALCASVASLHKGKIWVESEVGKGSEFFLRIPLKPQDKDLIEHPAMPYNNRLDIDFDTIINNEFSCLTDEHKK